jgi:predicted CopG family antitoxin
MRKKDVYRRIAIKEDMYQRLLKDRNDFQQMIGGGKWSINDVIREYIKILDDLKTKRIREYIKILDNLKTKRVN